MNISKKVINNMMKNIKNEVKIYCIRHGESTHNIDYLKYGRSTYFDKTKVDTKLTNNGINQAKNLGNTWYEINKNIPNKIDLIITSPLSRCLQTTTNIFGTTPIAPVLSLEDCREYPLGAHYCNKRTNLKTLKKKYHHIDFSNIYSDEDILWNETKETEGELEERVNEFKQNLKSIIKEKNYKNVVIVSHSTFLRKFIYDVVDEIFENELPHCTPIKYDL